MVTVPKQVDTVYYTWMDLGNSWIDNINQKYTLRINKGNNSYWQYERDGMKYL